MAEQGLVFRTVGLALNKFVIPDLVIVAELQASERNKFLKFFNTAEKDIFQSKAQYDAQLLSNLPTYITNGDIHPPLESRIHRLPGILEFLWMPTQ